MSWRAGYRDKQGHSQDSGERDRTGALAWLLDDLDQRPMTLVADDNGEPAGGDEVAELRTALRYWEHLAMQDGGECRAGAVVYWPAPSFDDQPPRTKAEMLRAASARRRQTRRPDNLDELAERITKLAHSRGAGERPTAARRPPPGSSPEQRDRS
jgi:hypothetical protein